MRDHPYIKLIEFALEKGQTQFSMDEAMKASGLSKDELVHAHDALFSKPKRLPGKVRDPGEREREYFTGRPVTWVLSPDAFFGYLSHLQREDSNRHAWITHTMVATSITVSLFGLLISAVTLLVIFQGWGAAG